MQYNTAIARMMELVNALYQVDEKEFGTPAGRQVISEVFTKLLPMLSSFVPHVAEELWEMLGNAPFLYHQPWPAYVEELTLRDEIEIVFQVNGKIRSKEQAPASITKEEMEKMALDDPRVKDFIEGKPIVKKIIVPGKLVNIVVKG